jgi:hypothetical protein
MAGFLEEVGKLKIEQIKVDGYVDGTYNTYMTYCGQTFAIKYHRYITELEPRKILKIDTAATLYDLTNGLDIIDRCNLYKDLLDDVLKLELKMEMKIQRGLKYNFDVEFVHSCLREIVNVVHNDIQDIYMNLQFDAITEGRQFHIPLPDYTIQNGADDYTEKKQSTNIAIKGNPENEILELIKQDTSFLIELIKKIDKQTENQQKTAVISETIEIMIRKNVLLPEPNPETGKYITSGSTPDAIAWIKLNDMKKKFPPKLFNAMIETKCEPETVEKYYRDL